MKLSGLTIFIIGLSIAIVALSFAYFHHWQPNITDMENNLKVADAYATEIRKQGQAEKRVKDAIATVNENAGKWNEIVAVYTLPATLGAGGINVGVNGWQLTVDAQRFRNEVQRDVNRQVKSGGVTVIDGPEVPDPSMEASSVLAEYFNYPAIPFPVVMFDFGTVTVRGTYDEIAENVRAWSRMPNYLAVADGLAIQGTSPNLTGTYNLSIVGYIQGKEIMVPVPEGATSGAAPGGAPGGGGPGGGRGGRGGRGADL